MEFSDTFKKPSRKILLWFLGLVGPLIILIILIYCGIASAFSFFSGAEEIPSLNLETCTLEELIEAVKDKDLFTDEMVDATMLDRKSLRRLLEAVDEYNKKQLRRTLTIEHTKTWKIKKTRLVPTYYIYNGRRYFTYHVETYIVSKSAKEGVDIVTDITWTRERYPIDWQVVYLLCIFHSIDYDEDIEYDEDAKPIRLTKSFIKQVIKDVGCDYDWEANAYEYDWSGYITSDEVRVSYGRGIYYRGNSFFVPDPSIYSKGYQYNGYVPINYLNTVRDLTYVDFYPGGGYANKNFVTTYDCSKLFELLNKYGQERTLGSFLEALKELPQGTRIANKFIYCLEQGGYEYE